MMAWAGSAGDTSTVARLAVGSLAAGLVVIVPERLRHARGAWLLVGVPWLAMIAAKAAPAVGRFTLYLPGDDPQTYQRFAYRIFMQGFWLRAGRPHSGISRYIAGFADSCTCSSATRAWARSCGTASVCSPARCSRSSSSTDSGGFRMGLAAAVAVLLTIFARTELVPHRPWPLRDFSAAVDLSGLVLFDLPQATQDPTRCSRWCVRGAGVLYADESSAAGPAAWCADPAPSTSTRRFTGRRAPDLGRRVETRRGRVLCGAGPRPPCAFAARTWYYTGAFSLFAGTSLGFNAVGLGTIVVVVVVAGRLAPDDRQRADAGDGPGSTAVRLAVHSRCRRRRPLGGRPAEGAGRRQAAARRDAGLSRVPGRRSGRPGQRVSRAVSLHLIPVA